MRTQLHIGEIAQLLGVTPKAIRHYQKVGLLAEPERTEAGYRLYGAQELLRLQLLDPFAQQGYLFSQRPILVSQLFQFFFFGHAGALLACSLFGKPLVLLVSY